MTLTIRYFRNNKEMRPDYSRSPLEKYIHGTDAADCMTQYHTFVNHHDLVKYSIARIVNVEDK